MPIHQLQVQHLGGIPGELDLRFIGGGQAASVVLYGDNGTGKSSWSTRSSSSSKLAFAELAIPTRCCERSRRWPQTSFRWSGRSLMAARS